MEHRVRLSPLRNHKRLNVTTSQFRNPVLREAGFDILRVLGKGNYGVVYLVNHGGREMAVKFFDKSRASDQTIASAREQARILATLNHDCIVRLHRVDDGKKYLALYLEYFEGENLDRFRQESGMDEATVKHIFKQVASGIAYLHGAGVIHRDLKLANILINSAKRIKIIDFGFSTTSVEGQLFDSFCGTPAFMAPELASKHHYEGRKVDSWALGVVLYFLLVGKMPFHSFSEARLFKMIEKGTYDTPELLSQGAKYLLSKILHVNPRERAAVSEIMTDTWLEPMDIARHIQMIRDKMKTKAG